MILIEVIVPDANARGVETVLINCCSTTGDQILGSRRISETTETLFLVCLIHDPNISLHLPVLSQALQEKTIAAFNFARGSVLKLNAPTIEQELLHFPFLSGDTWVQSLRSSQEIYLCIRRPLLTSEQAAWLISKENISWEYI